MTISEELQKDIDLGIRQIKGIKSIGPIYPWSNEGIDKYYDYYNLTEKRVLCITGSGDHAIYAASAGASVIDCVDINPLSKYYQELKLSLIKKYDENNFWKQISNNRLQVLNPNIDINSLKSFMDNNSFIFWFLLIREKEFKNNQRLFRFDGRPSPININYKKTRKNLSKTTITYYDDDIKYFIQDVDFKYDAIFLSNILEWEKTDANAEAILKNCLEKLNPNGVIYDAFCRREFNNEIEYEGFETKFPTRYFDKNEKNIDRGVYVYRKK